MNKSTYSLEFPPHSPGPWKWGHEKNDGATLYSSQIEPCHNIAGEMKTCEECGHEATECGSPVFVFADSLPKAKQCRQEGTFTKPSAEDKRLIAAAPDLLSALQRMLNNKQVCTAADKRTLKQARAAIAKAITSTTYATR